MGEKKYLIQNFEPAEAFGLLEKMQNLKAAGYRLGQMCCLSAGDGFDLIYSFDKGDHVLLNLKVPVPSDLEIMSITSIYWPAFIYENEIHDLFGITFKHLELDYGGHFFRISEKTPWNPKNKESEGPQNG